MSAQREDEIESEEGTAEATGPELRTCIDLPQAGRRDASLEESKLRDLTQGYGENVSNRCAAWVDVTLTVCQLLHTLVYFNLTSVSNLQ